MALCRRWASELKLPMDEHTMHPARMVVKARMALEHPSAFVIAHCEERLVAFVCSPVGRDVHRIDAVVWTEDAHRPTHFRALRRWHTSNYPDQRLVPGRLGEDELRAWEDE